EGGGRRVEVAMLEQRHSVREGIALERIVIAHPAKRKCLSHAIGCGGWDSLDILQQSLRIDRTLIHLNDHALSIEQEGGGNCEVPATVKQVTVDDVINARHIFRRKQDREGEPL